MAIDVERAIQQAWKDYADACCEHDLVHARHACAELAQLIPEQRSPVGQDTTPTKG